MKVMQKLTVPVLAILLLLFFSAIHAGLFDPIPNLDRGLVVGNEKYSLEKNSYSQLKTINISPKIKYIKFSTRHSPGDFDLSIESGDVDFRINPAGYAGLLDFYPLAPFIHVANEQNEIIFMIEDGFFLKEIWINRELFWRGWLAIDSEVRIEAASYNQPEEIQIMISVSEE